LAECKDNAVYSYQQSLGAYTLSHAIQFSGFPKHSFFWHGSFFFQAVSLYLPPLLCYFNHIMLSKHIHGGGAAFLEITIGFSVKAEENNSSR